MLKIKVFAAFTGCFLSGFALILLLATFPVSIPYLMDGFRATLFHGEKSVIASTVSLTCMVVLMALLLGSFTCVFNSKVGAGCMVAAGLIAWVAIPETALLDIGLVTSGALLFITHETTYPNKKHRTTSARQ